MLFPLLLAFTVVPAVEIALFLSIGSRIGLPATLAVILFTGIAGASLARSQGFRVLQDTQRALQEGRMPTDELIEGGLVLFGGALLLTPGFLTDLLGLACLIPGTRKAGAVLLRRGFARKLQTQQDGSFHVKGWDVHVGGVQPGPAASAGDSPSQTAADSDIYDSASARRRAPRTIDASFDVVEDPGSTPEAEDVVTDRMEQPES